VSSPGAAERYALYREALRRHHLPCAFVDVELFLRNVRDVAARAGGRPIRVASKSVRSVGLLRRVFEADPAYRGVMAYSAAEAVYLAECGFDDLLVAYPVTDAEELEAVARAVAGGRRITLTVDSLAHVERLEALAAGVDVRLALCLDVDMSSAFPGLHFGVRRSPVGGVAAALEVARAIARSSHLRLEGVLGYEAQIAGVRDAVPGQALKSAVVRWLKRRSKPEVHERRQAVVEALRREGIALRFVNGGGTGSLETTRDDPSVTELAAGSGFYSPALFDSYRGFRHLPAAGFALAITRCPAPGIFTCHGGGYVASGAAGRDKLPLPYLPQGARLLDNEGAGEVQTPVAYRGPERLAVGDPIFFRHAKAGELCERFATLALLCDGRVTDEVTTYRGDGRCFL